MYSYVYVSCTCFAPKKNVHIWCFNLPATVVGFIHQIVCFVKYRSPTRVCWHLQPMYTLYRYIHMPCSYRCIHDELCKFTHYITIEWKKQGITPRFPDPLVYTFSAFIKHFRYNSVFICKCLPNTCIMFILLLASAQFKKWHFFRIGLVRSIFFQTVRYNGYRFLIRVHVYTCLHKISILD